MSTEVSALISEPMLILEMELLLVLVPVPVSS
jgi:hypothetical protein